LGIADNVLPTIASTTQHIEIGRCGVRVVINEGDMDIPKHAVAILRYETGASSVQVGIVLVIAGGVPVGGAVSVLVSVLVYEAGASNINIRMVGVIAGGVHVGGTISILWWKTCASSIEVETILWIAVESPEGRTTSVLVQRIRMGGRNVKEAVGGRHLIEVGEKVER
jgi:hypothetical protein